MGINPTPLFRYLAAAALPRVFAYYVLALTVSQFFLLRAASGQDSTMAWMGWLCFAFPFSLLFAVVALYRDDDLLAATVLLGVTTGVGALAARALVATVLTRSIGPAILMIGLAPIGLFIRFLITMPVLALMVWLARKLRRFLAPDTMNDERISAA